MDSCRACLYTGSDILNIHKNKCDIIYKECTSLEIDINDDLPHGICSLCFNTLNQFYFFKQMSNHSNTTLLSSYRINRQNIASIAGYQNYEFPVNNEENIEHIKLEPQLIDLSKRIESDVLEDKFICDYCSKECLKKCHLISHLQTHKKIIEHKCHMCNKVLKSNYSLRIHLKIHLPIVEEVFKCEHCSKSWIRKQDLVRHLQMHKEIPDNKCHVCNKAFKRSECLKTHLKRHSNVNDKQVFECDHCSRVWFRKQDLITHLQVHKSFLDNKCQVCNKSYKSKYYLKKHKQIHLTLEDRKLFECNNCSRVFHKRCVLIKHLQLHKEFSDLKCPICNKLFKVHQTLTAHLRSHANVILKCHVCDRLYKSKSTLNRHLKSHVINSIIVL